MLAHLDDGEGRGAEELEEVDEDWELEDYMEEEESSEVTSNMGLSFQVDTSDLDSFKDRWMSN